MGFLLSKEGRGQGDGLSVTARRLRREVDDGMSVMTTGERS